MNSQKLIFACLWVTLLSPQAHGQQVLNFTQAGASQNADGLQVRLTSFNDLELRLNTRCMEEVYHGWGTRSDCEYTIGMRRVEYCNRSNSEWRGALVEYLITPYPYDQQRIEDRTLRVTNFIRRFPRLDMRSTPAPRSDPDFALIDTARTKIPANSCITRDWENRQTPHSVRVIVHRVRTPYEHIVHDPLAGAFPF